MRQLERVINKIILKQDTKMLKEQLLKEAKEIEASVELDSIFESVDLSDEVKQNFSTVFETAVKKHALALAESHIIAIAEKAEEKVEDEVEEKTKKIEESILAVADKFFEHTAAEWLKENKVAVHKGIKADLFESMFEGLKELVIEHNVVLPAESVDVVAEMEEELEEAKAETSRMFESMTESKAELNALKRTVAVNEATADLTESQQEKVHNLIEGLDYSDSFESKLHAIVEMAKASKSTNIVSESTQETEINNTNKDAEGLNFVVESVEETKAQPKTAINQYVAAAQKI